MNLDKFTYGKSPAALYLTLYLNEKNDPVLNRKVGRTLEKWRKRIYEVTNAHARGEAFTCMGQLSADTFRCIIEQFDTAIRGSVGITDPLCRNLVISILIGELKNWKQRGVRTRKLQTQLARETPDGESVPKLKVMALEGDETLEQRIERLTEKSRAYLKRKGKINTLY
jgi:hypothetical protein